MGSIKTPGIALLVIMGFTCIVPAHAEAKKNVVFVLIDALRADCIEGTRNGVPLMPYLSGLPAVHFRNAVTPASSTLPAMTSIFTSQYVDTHGTFSDNGPFPPNHQSMATYFKEAGYTTIGIQTNPNLTPEWGFSTGFDQYSMVPAKGAAETVTAQALAATQSLDQPFFLYAHYLDTHLPYTPPPSYQTLLGYPDPALQLTEVLIVEDFMPYFFAHIRQVLGVTAPDAGLFDHFRDVMGLTPTLGNPILTDVGKEAVRTFYDGAARYTDDQVRILLEDILGRFPDTIVVVLADHGEHFWEHNYLGHLFTVYEQLVHVPFIIKAPGLPPANVDDLVNTVGLLPTLAELLGLPAKPAWQGRSVFAAHDPQGPVFSCTKIETFYPLDLHMARLGSMKVICSRRTGTVELYDLAQDPGEAVNLAPQQPAMARQMLDMLNLQLRQNARLNGADSPLCSEPDGPVEEGMTVRLTAPEGTGHVWFRDGQPIGENPPRLAGANTPLLSINPLAAPDSGAYECMYSDAKQNLRITTPHKIDVLPVGGVPVAGAGTAAMTGTTAVSQALAEEEPAAPETTFRKHLIMNYRGEACCVADFNSDGKLDIVALPHVYLAPDFRAVKICDVEGEVGEDGKGYSSDTMNVPLDVDGDGLPDVVITSGCGKKLEWLRNSGKFGNPWVRTLVEENVNYECGELRDVDGDGKPLEILPAGDGTCWYEAGTLPDGKRGLVKHVISEKVMTRGVGCGDVNGDGRPDVLRPDAWFEAPADPRKGVWKEHPWAIGGKTEGTTGHTGAILVCDVNKDGLPDIIAGSADNYGIFWYEQGKKDGKTTWKRHTIDNSWSQAHSLALADLDGDGDLELVAGKRFMAHNGGDPGETDLLGLYWYHISRKPEITWTPHVISYNERIGSGLNLVATDLDGDGDVDVVVTGKWGGPVWFENLRK